MSVRTDFAGKTYWLVGASAGIGAALARQMDALGASMILSGRSRDALSDLADELQNDPRVVVCDVTDDTSVASAAAEAGEIDGVIFMAGDYDPMTAQNWDGPAAARISDVNYSGVMRVMGHVVPTFADRDAGHILIVGSLAGFAGLPGAIAYGASKAAAMHLAENLYVDLKETGVKVQLANPGFVKTRLTDKNAFRMPFIMTPEVAAGHIVKHMRSRRFSRSFPSLFAWFFKLRAIWYLLRA